MPCFIIYTDMDSEEILQFIWKRGLLGNKKSRTACGINLEILDPGSQNFNAGPDFFNARIYMNRLLWAGNVEVHLIASDWVKHNHHLDPAYDNVILHVVREFDVDVRNSKGRRIPAFVLNFQQQILAAYNSEWRVESWLPCSSYLKNVPTATLKPWFNQLLAERLHYKTGRISRILSIPGMNREETFYRAMASGFGLPINSLPFEMVASGIPLQPLMELRDNLPVLEAIFFGQSGFLQSAQNQSPYAINLANLYNERVPFIPGKPVSKHLWKFLRLRPASFPTVRLSQFAALLHKRFPITDSIMATSSLVEIEQLLRVRASKFWDTHYVFGKCSPLTIKYMGHQSIISLIINVIVPFLRVMGKTEQKPEVIHRATSLLTELKAESNHIIKKWEVYGIKPCNAVESQALIQLHHNYCKQNRCIQLYR